MADDERPLARKEELRQYFTIAGILDGLTATPGVQAVFQAWDAQLGISAKARRLAEAHRKLRDLGDLADRGSARRRREALMTGRAAAQAISTTAAGGHDLWDPEVLGQAGEVVHAEMDLGGQPRTLADQLAFGLIERFVYNAAERSGWSLDPAPDVPDVEPRVGERLAFAVPEYYPAWFARVWLEDFYQQTVKQLDAIEEARRGPRRPVEAEAAVLRRMGRTLFLLKLKKPPRPRPEEVGREYDAAAGRDHDSRGAECLCHHAVSDDLTRAAEVVGALRP
jgi:hypothetical protein